MAARGGLLVGATLVAMGLPHRYTASLAYRH